MIVEDGRAESDCGKGQCKRSQFGTLIGQRLIEHELG